MDTPRTAAPSLRHAALVAALRAFGEQSDRAAELAGRSLGLNRTDLRALAVLMARADAGRETTVTDLGQGLHLTKAATTAVVDRLVASGHATRRRSTEDGRRVLVDHTPSAVADGRAAFLPLVARIDAALEHFEEAELTAALRVVQAATTALDPLVTPDAATRPVLIGVDGRSGAGKSTLAAALRERLSPHARVAVLPLESMYPGWDGLGAVLAPDGPYVVALRHLRDGGTAHWRAWDWSTGAPGAPAAAGPADVVVCEGVGALCAPARALLDLRVWVELDDDVRRERALARDGAAYAPHWERWARQERAYLAAEDPRAAADLVIAS